MDIWVDTEYPPLLSDPFVFLLLRHASHPQKLVETVQSRVQEHLGTSFSLFQAVSYTQQVVAGMVYHVKIKTAADNCNDDDSAVVHVRIFEPLPYTKEPPELQAAVMAKHDDKLVPLEPRL